MAQDSPPRAFQALFKWAKWANVFQLSLEVPIFYGSWYSNRARVYRIEVQCLSVKDRACHTVFLFEPKGWVWG